ncbi:MAG: acetyl-CoA C-acetyltransferase [Spirochaetia bacterium]|nr:acetyl-CoA C-acetyltransferase [Spirochaetia bacterium]
METVYIFDAVRTPRGKGKKRGVIANNHPQNLAGATLRALAERNKLDAARVEDVVLGCVSQVSEQGACIARYAVMAAEWPDTVPGYTVNRFCGSGLQAINNGVSAIGAGASDLVVAGGVESMSRVKMGDDVGELGMDIGNPFIAEHYNLVPQGISADLIATKYGFSREDVDRFAVESQEKADHAIKNGYFKKSIIPVKDQNGNDVLLDEHPRIASDYAFLSGLGPVFKTYGESGADAIALKTYPDIQKINHVHTLGNSSGVVDGAAVILVGSEKARKDYGLKPRARVVSMAATGSEPTIMLTGPASASKLALQKAGLKVEDIDLFEINEAFAAVVLFVQKELNISKEKINVNGGAIALGHPLGGTGAILIGTLVDELERRKARYGLATLCIGGGMGIATVIERIDG